MEKVNCCSCVMSKIGRQSELVERVLQDYIEVGAMAILITIVLWYNIITFIESLIITMQFFANKTGELLYYAMPAYY